MGTANRKQKPVKAKEPAAGAGARNGSATAKKIVRVSKPVASAKSKPTATATATATKRSAGVGGKPNAAPTKLDSKSEVRTEAKLEPRVEPRAEHRTETRLDAGRDSRGDHRGDSKPVAKNGIAKAAAGVRPEADVVEGERVPPPLPVPIASFTF